MNEDIDSIVDRKVNRFFAIIFILVFSGVVIKSCFFTSTSNTKEVVKPLSLKDKALATLSGYDGSLRSLVVLIKENMNDPSSFEHVETRIGDYQPKDFAASMKYRGKNAFGAVITKYVDVRVSYDGTVLYIEKEY